MRASPLGPVRVFSGGAQLEEAHLADFHARPQFDRQRADVGQFKRDMPFEARVDEAGGGMGEDTQTAQ